MAQPRDPEDVIRELLVRELDTVNVYTEMIASAKTPAVRELLTEIARQEKHHIAEAVDMLSRHDAGQAAALERAGVRRAQARDGAGTVGSNPRDLRRIPRTATRFWRAPRQQVWRSGTTAEVTECAGRAASKYSKAETDFRPSPIPSANISPRC